MFVKRVQAEIVPGNPGRNDHDCVLVFIQNDFISVLYYFILGSTNFRFFLNLFGKMNRLEEIKPFIMIWK